VLVRFLRNEGDIMTPQEWKDKTVKDIAAMRKRKTEGEKQAKEYSFDNMRKVQRRINR
jgi:hypothetical protein